ncbi:MAG: limonene-1,2-epoxide hydrolase [SAR202 cluster bacterium]|jgi:limonene-1,2-epoxide hydrolase|nr:limonene-1,2-epoxide hydrolase [Chloroflexota bacterium]MDP6422376.1 limonene-1,2-epoxide hydrolase family protein [SAR202 cluster bacterium]HAL48036.1 limonene-1,2-epoxide hydrolase [Dehalococcoidia bacterium]MDP6663528.1 limonene-1,2-epoxide hydrolase family protein [SAR202 cluster bacterium]MDP6800787.1 limonene-1,2-epoxide hydrolase family protein [SAR202 cluster bacterium]|tara:strand:- start:3401 stop:3781 length:381 start_codon:yes stop_codon:yes gene_type:complete
MESPFPEQLVRDFCAAWSRLDIDELVEFFADDAVYHNMPGPPWTGKDAIRAGITSFISDWISTEWIISNLAVSGNLVFAERIDRTGFKGRKVDLPLVGVFEVQDGKIRHWRDYFDLATYRRADSSE